MYSRLMRLLFRFFAWWGGLFALLAAGSVCPCCGTATCPGGAASAGILSGLVAVLLFVPRWFRRMLRWHRKDAEILGQQAHACCAHQTGGRQEK